MILEEGISRQKFSYRFFEAFLYLLDLNVFLGSDMPYIIPLLRKLRFKLATLKHIIIIVIAKGVTYD